jgi:hypothetical protein
LDRCRLEICSSVEVWGDSRELGSLAAQPELRWVWLDVVRRRRLVYAPSSVGCAAAHCSHPHRQLLSLTVPSCNSLQLAGRAAGGGSLLPVAVADRAEPFADSDPEQRFLSLQPGPFMALRLASARGPPERSMTELLSRGATGPCLQAEAKCRGDRQGGAHH